MNSICFFSSRNQINAHNNICPKAPEVLFDDRNTYFHGIDDDQQRSISSRLSSATTMTRQLSNLSLNQSVNSIRKSQYDVFFLSLVL